jgi:hypothetical protein
MAYRFQTRSTTPGANRLTNVAVELLFAEQKAVDVTEVDAVKASILTSVTNLLGSVNGTFNEADRNTDPGVANVWNAITWKLANVTKTGTKRASSLANCSAGNIKSGVAIDDVTGSYGGGAGTPPATPTLAVTISGTTATATITGTDGVTYTVLYKTVTATAWSTSSTRVGSGTISIASLAEQTGYYFIAYATLGSDNSTPSVVYYAYCGASTATDVIEKSLYYILANDATIAGLVSTKIYPNHIPQSATAPMIVYVQITGDRDHVLGSATGYVKATFQLNLWDDDYSGARTLANAVRNLLDDYSGIVGTVVIHRILIENERDISNFPSDTQLLFRYGKVLDFTVWFNE